MGDNPPLSDMRRLIGRKAEIETLSNHVNNRRNVVIMGVEGVGKSSLIKCFFNRSYRLRMAVENNLLICVTDFPVELDTGDVYQYLADGVLSVVDNLDQPQTQDIYQQMSRKCEEIKQRYPLPASHFEQVCKAIENFDYYIMFVIDGFERFVSSPQVTMEHHNLMNTLLSKNLSFVVATDYDFNKTSIPEGVSGSFLLQKFSQNSLTLTGLSMDSCEGVLRPGDFSSDEIYQLWILSGGIPKLMRRAAEQAWKYKEQGITLEQRQWKDVESKTYHQAIPLLQRWCKFLSMVQVEAIKGLAETPADRAYISFTSPVLSDAAQILETRGLLTLPLDGKSFKPIPGLHQFCTILLRQYCRKRGVVAHISVRDSESILSGESIRNLIEAPHADRKTIIYEYGRIAEVLGLPAPIAFQSELTDEELRRFELTRETFDGFPQQVRDFLADGIRVEQTFRSVQLVDYAPAYIAFAKAVESHLNLTLVPVLKEIDPELSIRVNNIPTRLRDTAHLMLGNITFVLSGAFTQRAASYCTQDKNQPAFDQRWWRDIRRDVDNIRRYRNELPHSDFFQCDDGKSFLQLLFGEINGLFSRCQRLYDSVIGMGPL